MNRQLLRSFSVFVCTLASIALLSAPTLHADELKLKDGTKIVGTIVGFEEDSFKVKTSYGFAVIQKDHVLSISMSDGAAEPDNPAKKDESSREKSTAPKAKAEMNSPAASPLAKANAVPEKSSPDVSSAAASSAPAAPATATATHGAPPVAAATAPASAEAAPPKPPEPEPIREAVNGNTYTNETYRFHMYKPPDWEVIRAANTILPGAVAAMGTDDDTTYLLIGQQPAGKSIAIDADSAEKRLQSVMENFRPLDDEQLTIGGLAVTARHFRGTVDDQDWSGVVVLIPHGSRVYTVFGMTRADNDLVQIQENVIARAISSLQFTD